MLGFCMIEIKMNCWVIRFLIYRAAFSILLHRCILPISCLWHLSEILPRYRTAVLCCLQLIGCTITSAALASVLSISLVPEKCIFILYLHHSSIQLMIEYSNIYMMLASKQAVARGLKDPSNRVIQNHFAVEGNLGEIAAKVIFFKSNFFNQTSHN